ncbi:MAG: orotidine 5-phosphate decarboxylase [Paracoccaceae bacterium]
MKHQNFPTPSARISDVIYNAANQSFEATVTLFESSVPVKYACQISAPITMSFDEASRRLIAQARRQQKTPSALRARMMPAHCRAVPRRPRTSLKIWQSWSHSGFLRRRVA